MDITSTPSSTALSMAANTSDPKHPYSQHTLYMDSLAFGAIPVPSPLAYPKKDTFSRILPAGIDLVYNKINVH